MQINQNSPLYTNTYSLIKINSKSLFHSTFVLFTSCYIIFLKMSLFLLQLQIKIDFSFYVAEQNFIFKYHCMYLIGKFSVCFLSTFKALLTNANKKLLIKMELKMLKADEGRLSAVRLKCRYNGKTKTIKLQ